MREHVHDLEVIWGQRARRGGRCALETSIPGPSPLPLGGQLARHLLRVWSRDDQVFMPSMLCLPAGWRGPRAL